MRNDAGEKGALPSYHFLALFFFCCFLSACNHRPRLIKVTPPKKTDVESDVISLREENERKKLLLAAEQYVRAAEKVKVKGEFVDLVSECEAKIADVPIPLGVSPIERYFRYAGNDNADGFVVAYASQLDETSLVDFFTREMACFGWRLTLHINGIEKIIVFAKPTKICVISIRSSDGQNKHFPCQFTVAIGNTLNILED